MAKVGIIYGSSTGKTEEAADLIQQVFGTGEVISIAQMTRDKFEEFDILILGTSTWGTGDLQDDWDEQKDLLNQINWSNKTVAFFGMGDQESFSETYLNGLGQLYSLIAPHSPRIIGQWSTDGYYFETSKALVNGQFVGLALDDDNQGSLTEERITRWASGLKKVLNLN